MQVAKLVRQVTLFKRLGINRLQMTVAGIVSIGAGALIDLREFGYATEEPLVADSVKAGADVITFSGDKLIGGPQAGILLGRKEWIDRIRKNPLARVLRVCKMTMAAMEATLKLFLDREVLLSEHPVYRLISLSIEEIEKRGRKLAKRVNAEFPDLKAKLVDEPCEMGGGSMPTEQIPSRSVALISNSMSSLDMCDALRQCEVPVFSRVQNDMVLLDVRTLQDGDEKLILSGLREIQDNA